MALRLLLAVFAVMLACTGVSAQIEMPAATNASLFAKKRGPLIDIVQRGTNQNTQVGSLFAGQIGNSLFAPYPARPKVGQASGPLYSQGSDIAHLRALISAAESRHGGYDAVQYGARIKPPKLPTQMTLGNVFDWINATPGQPHAIGRYQFIPATLRQLVAESGLSDTTPFSPPVQDQLADLLLADAGLDQFRGGQISRREFMQNLAKIWAGLPLASGRSYYEGYAGNKASISWAKFDTEMARIFPG